VVHGDKVAVDAILTHPLVRSDPAVRLVDIAAYVYSTGAAHERVQAMGGARTWRHPADADLR
jgi:malonate-semialdehyde dehydrogenase (acetylating)/methylmalonate-semialdehyde dehydrogenase